jgi:oligoribonuclease NrnB/cAMP/cGMP phosphodiesterase (DHH superfamily)
MITLHIHIQTPYKHHTMTVLICDEIDFVIYHDKCHDGFGSAFAIWHYFKTKFGLDRANAITYHGATHSTANETVLPECTGKNVIICDFSYKYPDICKIIEQSKSFFLIDHHKGAQQNLEQLDSKYKIFDMNFSAAVLTYVYLHGAEAEVPDLYKYIQDRDLFTRKLEFNEEFSIAIFTKPMTFNEFEKYLDPVEVQALITQGKNYIPYQKNLLQNCLAASAMITVAQNGYNIAYSNNSMFKSDMGNLVFSVYTKADFSAIYHYDNATDKTYYSLRSTNDRMDVIPIANKFGGGGHRNSSGATLMNASPWIPFEQLIENDSSLQTMKTNGADIVCTLDVINADHIEYENYLLNNNLHNVGLNIVQIEGKPYVIAYCNSCALRQKMTHAIINKYYLADFVAVYYYDNHTNKTYYHLMGNKYSIKVITSFFDPQVCVVNGEFEATMTFDGIAMSLPFTILEKNASIISSIQYGIKNFARKIVLDGHDIPYCVVTTSSSHNAPSIQLIRMIKSKMSDFMIILFKNNTSYRLYLNEYFNAMNENISMNMLSMMAEQKITDDLCLIFSTDKDINDVMTSMMMKNIFSAISRPDPDSQETMESN